jgi:hypothetical protein
MFTHCVFFWLKEGMTADEKAVFERKLRALIDIPSVLFGSVGTPAATERSVIDRSYTWGLTVAFEDLAGHDAYQVDETHLDFRDTCSKFFQKVVVYDFEG